MSVQGFIQPLKFIVKKFLEAMVVTLETAHRVGVNALVKSVLVYSNLLSNRLALQN